MNKKTLIPFSILFLSLFSSTLFGKIGIIVNKDLYSSIQNSLSGYIADLNSIENKEVWLDKDNFDDTNTPQELKAALKDHYQSDNLEAAILIGDLPIAKYSLSGETCDLYYMDLDGSWSGTGSTFSNHSGNKEGEIWISRITASVLEKYFDDEVTMVNEYFAKVKTRMYGQDPMERKYVIAGQKSEWGGLEAENQGDLGYDPSNIDTYTGSCGSQWGAALVDGREYGFVYSHSYATGHSIGYDINDQASDDMDCRFFNSYACSNALITTANMCGAYAYADAGLICVGSSKSGSMIPGSFGAYNVPLGQGKSFGEAYLDWFNEEGIYNAGWHYGMHLQGVGTLHLEPYASGPYLAVSYPNGGEELEQGSTYDITWGSNVGGNVKVELYKGGSLKEELVSSMANSGTYSWTIPGNYELGTDYKVKIKSLENDTILDESNDNFSITEELILSVPYLQPFDDWGTGTKEMAPWEQLTGDDMDWTIISGATPSRVGSSPDQTGAEADHTSGSGKYIYTEASSNENKETLLLSPKFDFRYLNEPKLTVWYHMFSQENEMGDFYVDVKVGAADWQEGIIEISGDQGDSWKEKTIELSSITQGNQRVRFRLRGITGSSWCSDICIDDFEIHGNGTGINNAGMLSSSYTLCFNKSRIRYCIPDINKNVHVNIKLYNIQGKLIKTLVDKAQSSGSHFVELNSREHKLAAGLYLCKMKAGEFTKTINVIMRK